MRIIKSLILLFVILISSFSSAQAHEDPGYDLYHQQTLKAEQLIVSGDYKAALGIYTQLFSQYEFVFLRDYQVATQLAFHQDDQQNAILLLRKGMRAGWSLKSIKKNDFIKTRLTKETWKSIKKEYPDLKKEYESKLNQALRKQVKKMYSRDQWNAFKVFLKFRDKVRTRYTEKKFIPHSEKQIAEFTAILANYGYPGEQLIGDNVWMSTILSHHNSISTAYNKKDQLYPNFKPQLQAALISGQASPHELAVIDEWYLASKYDRTKPAYGILDPPSSAEISKTNELRAKLFLRPVELRASLIDTQKKTGMNFYLPDIWY